MSRGFLPTVTAAGPAGSLLALLEELPVGGEWLITREALKAVEDETRLDRLIPEMRKPVQML